VVAPSAISAGSTYFLSDVGSTVLPAFTGGTLQVDTNGQTSAQNFTLGASGTNRIDQRGNSATFSGVLSDAVPGTPGSVSIANSESGGRIVFSGVNSYTGTTLIDAGATLAVDGSIVSPVTVNGTLRGTGLIGGSTTIASGGTLAPGDSPGTLTFAAPVAMAPGATLEFDIDGIGPGTGAGNYSRVIVTGAGSSFTADGTLQPLLRGITPPASNSFTPSLGQQFNVIAAEGGVLGGFTSLTQPAGLAQGTRFDALYAPNSVNLAVTPASYGNLGRAGLPQTSNQSSVGRALDAARPAAGLRMSGATASLFARSTRCPARASRGRWNSSRRRSMATCFLPRAAPGAGSPTRSPDNSMRADAGAGRALPRRARTARRPGRAASANCSRLPRPMFPASSPRRAA
jgi:autotransporter-associated beta strand protein